MFIVFLVCLLNFVFSVPSSHIAARFLSRGFIKAHNEGNYGKTASTSRDSYTESDDCQFKSYRPELFSILRSHSGISESLYQSCLIPSNLECLSADSKSGQAFWRSIGGVLVVKTIKQYECKNMRMAMDSYATHILTTDHSCIARILGLYRVKLNNGGKKYFLVTKNVYKQSQTNGLNATNVMLTFDLKGSTVGRLRSPTSPVLKDLDLINGGYRLRLGKAKQVLMRTLQRDVAFLRESGFMDYSVLAQVETASPNTFQRFLNRVLNKNLSQPIADKGKLVLLGESGDIYHFGIIDFLQKYTLRKYLETLFKSMYLDGSRISCVAPARYAQRMLEFFDCITQ